MKILYADYKMFGKADIIEAFRKLGHEVEETDIPLKYEGDGARIEEEMERLLSDVDVDIVFSSNFHPELVRTCEKKSVKYVSWTYDSPLVSLYDKEILSPVSYAFHFDSAEVAELKARGAKQVWYMPLAVNPDRLSKVGVSAADRRLFSADVSLVASLYNEEHNLYDRLVTRLDEYTIGFLEGVLNAQVNLLGGSILEDVLRQHTDIVKAMYKAMPYPLTEGSIADEIYVYAYYFLARKAANMQRMKIIKAVSERFDTKVYTGGNLSSIPTAKAMGTVDYMTDMTKVFRCSKVNLNITLPSIRSGMPLRTLDIMGAGGFLMTNHQADFDAFFDLGIDYGCYDSADDLLYTIEYYLEHEDEREEIRLRGHEKVCGAFTYENMLGQMLEICNND